MSAPLPAAAPAAAPATEPPSAATPPTADHSGWRVWASTFGAKLRRSPPVGRCLALGGALSVLLLSARLLGLAPDLTLWQAGGGLLLGVGGVLLVLPQWLGWPRQAAVTVSVAMLLLTAVTESLRASIAATILPPGLSMLTSLLPSLLAGAVGLLLLPAFLGLRSSSLVDMLTALVGGVSLASLGASSIVGALALGINLWSTYSVLPAAVLIYLALWLGALALARLETRLAYRWTARLLLWRSMLMRTTGLLVGFVVAIHTYPPLFSVVWRLAFATLVEGLAGTLATFGCVLIGMLTVAVFLLLPRLIARGQLAGRLNASAAAESVWFAVLVLLPGSASLVLAIGLSINFDPRPLESLGASVFFAAVTHTLLRLLFGRPLIDYPPGANMAPLFVFLPERTPTAASLTLAERVLLGWPGGPVTLVAPPSAVWQTGGPHLRLAQQAGLLPALFVERLWQMSEWQRLRLLPAIARAVLPLGELYGGRVAWQAALAEAPGVARRLVIVGDSPLAWDAAFFTALPEDSEIVADPAAVIPQQPLAVQRVAFNEAARRNEWLAAFQRRQTPATLPVRRLLLLHAPHDATLAQRLAAALDGLRDTKEQRIVAATLSAGKADRRVFLQLDGRSLTTLAELFVRFSARAAAQRSDLLARMSVALVRQFFSTSPARVDLLVIETGRAADGDAVLARGLERDADAVFSLLPADSAVDAPRLYDVSAYEATWRLPPRSTLDAARMAELGQFWLDGRWAPLSTDVGPNERPAASETPAAASDEPPGVPPPELADAEPVIAPTASPAEQIDADEPEAPLAESSPPTSPVKAYVFHASQDQFEWQTLRDLLAPLVADGALVFRQEALPGKDWAAENAAALAEAELLLLLLSPAFLESPAGRYELEAAVKRALSAPLRLLPILLRRCDWQGLPLASFQILPADGVPVVDSPVPERTYANVADEIARQVRALCVAPASSVERAPSAAAKKSAKRKVRDDSSLA